MNVHSIVIQLESILRNEFEFIDRPFGTIFDADAIENSTFYDSMVLLLVKKGIKYVEFEENYNEYKGINMNKISDCKRMFEDFIKLIGR